MPRRLHYVLAGLPPTAEEIGRFTTQCVDPDSLTVHQPALERYIDDLLASPHFGERWGRHFLDVARYADVAGNDNPQAMPQAWRYRGYVIDAFNKDKPFDRFVREQIAEDLMPSHSPEERAECLVATSFLTIGHVIKADRDGEHQKLEIIDEQMDVLGRAFIGIQIGCARCHDHRLDPFPTRDYYALAGVFRSSETLGGRAPKGDGLLLRPPRVEIDRLPASAPAYLRTELGAKTFVHAAGEADVIRDEPIHLRGRVDITGDLVPRGLLSLDEMADVPQIPDDALVALNLPTGCCSLTTHWCRGSS
jgi:hypothetical protein